MITLQGEPENVQNFPLEVIVDKNPVFTEDVVGNGTFRVIKCVERTLVEIFRL